VPQATSSQLQAPDVVVVGCQEFTALNAQQLLPQLAKKQEFERLLVAMLSHMHDCTYAAVHPRHGREVPAQLAGLLTLVFVRADGDPQSALHVEGAHTALIPTGLGGLSGNKGGIAFRLSVAGFPLVFVNMHLPSGNGSDSREQRNLAFADVLRGAAKEFANAGLPVPLERHATFCFGDLNYRLTMPNREVRWRMSCRDWRTLLCADQLLAQLGEPTSVFAAWDEAEIEFRPTYKYDVGTSRFDTSDKARAPAWCDRVLWRGEHVAPLQYESCMHVVRSDHKPVKFLAKVVRPL
jgi:hypothetical protein